jgi:hypothetical protein
MRLHTLLLTVPGFLLAVGLTACSDDNDGGTALAVQDGGGDGPAGGDGAATDGASGDGAPGDGSVGVGSGAIGAPGGRLVSADGLVTLDVPRGALPAPVTIAINPVATPPAGATGTVYDITPAGVRFAKPARLFFAGGGDAAAVTTHPAVYAGAHWVQLPAAKPDTTLGTLAGTVTDLGRFALITGFCSACTTTCDQATCRFGADKSIPGKCMAYGNGCSKCVPACDGDGDGFCPGHPGQELPGDDCNDSNALASPTAPEICGNHIDDDCDGQIDEGCTPCKGDDECTVGLQACIDGYCDICDSGCKAETCMFGDAPNAVPGRCATFSNGCSKCVPGCDKDGDGFCPGMPDNRQPGGDCDDSNRNVRPNATEICGNGIDDNCDGKIDELCTACTKDTDCPASFGCREGTCQSCTAGCTADTCRFRANDMDPGVAGKCVPFGNGCTLCVPVCDGDGDGACPGGPGNGQPGNDCRDNDANVHPGAAEICGNGVDDNCDGHVDEGCTPCTRDAECTQGVEACLKGVCDVCPGACDPNNCLFGKTDVVGSGVAGRCAGYGNGCTKCVPACDTDGDGFCPGMPGSDQPGGDCNDADVLVHPGSLEICGNGADDNCDGHIDEGCATCAMGAMCAASESCSTTK